MSFTRCAGLNRKHGAASAWTNCPREAARGDRYCAKHRDALDGAFLGLMSRAKSLHAIQKIFYEAPEARRKEIGRERARRKQARRAEKARLAKASAGAQESRRQSPGTICGKKEIAASSAAAPAKIAAANPESA